MFLSKPIDRQIIIAAPSINFADRALDLDEGIKLYSCIVGAAGEALSGTRFEQQWLEEAKVLNKILATLEKCQLLNTEDDQER